MPIENRYASLLRIALDATYSIGRNLSGVGVYSNEILTRLPAAHAGPDYLFCYRPHRLARSLRMRLPDGARRRLLWKDWPRGADLFHALNQRVDSTRHPCVVSTFHDLFVLTGDYSPLEFRRRFARQARQAAENSDLIIAVSQFTADQVEDLLKVDRSRIRVVRHGVNQVAAAPGERTSKTILFVGAIQKRKNVLRLVQAFERTPPDWKLVLAGATGYGAEEILHAIGRSAQRHRIEVPGYVTEAQLADLYGTASIFAFPSLDEGFGMPVLEAMAHGLPVVTSHGSALAEVAGDAALLADPRSVDSIADSLNQLIGDEGLRKQLSQKGYVRSASFTWERAVELTWGVYRELL